MIDLTTYKLGETDQLIVVELKDDLRQLILEMALQAQYRILIFSHDLDGRLYNNEALYEAIKNLAIKNRRTHIQILVQDPKPMVSEDHCLLKLARRISSHMSIKVTAKEHQDIFENFIVFDDRAFIKLENPSRFNGQGNFYSPLKTQKLTELFTEMWERGVVDSSLRQLSL